MNGISKSFPGVKAVDNVDLYLEKGEIMALVGENGAGKSTLMKILAGAYKHDEGSIVIDGTNIESGKYGPRDAIGIGVSVIYQELNYLKTVSVAENIFIGRLPKSKNGMIDYKKLYKDSIEIQKQLGLENIDPSEEVEGLLTAQKQLLEIARAFARNAKIIVMDEPTASLTDKEIEHLYSIMRKFTQGGGSIIFVSHKLDEVFTISDSVMVMRDGKNVMRKPIAELTKNDVITAMVGRELKDMYPVGAHEIKEPVFEIRNLSTDFLKDINLTVRAGEIVGLYGLMGAGCENVTSCIYGIERFKSGEFIVDGKKTDLSTPAKNIAAGIAFVPSERKSGGLLLNLPIKMNISIASLKKIKKHGMLDLKKEENLANEWSKRLHIKTPDVFVDAESLSGGNQQKVVFAKEMNLAPKLLILNEPTRGVDVGAKVEIYKLMEKFCQDGVGILMVSTEMPETMAIADKIIVLHNGKITAEFEKSQKEYDQFSLMKAVLGE
jgi:ABC-type sugar transport system ATPase subunit